MTVLLSDPMWLVTDEVISTLPSLTSIGQEPKAALPYWNRPDLFLLERGEGRYDELHLYLRQNL